MHNALLITPFAVALALFGEMGTEFISIQWQQLTALAAVIIVLLWLVIKLVPNMIDSQAKQSTMFSASSQAQTEASVRATAAASAEATKAMAAMHDSFNATLDRMHARYHDDNTAIVDAVNALAQHCAASRGDGATIHAVRRQREEDHGK